ncbi:MAG TPA: SBBP repeat-containing protein [Chitinophagales bacterium]|nr:SBBP repeat-containing protein [Chitinophagales bacterium]
MKKLHYLMLVIIAAMIIQANTIQAQAFQWVTTAGAPCALAVNGVATDGSGNIYVVGTFDGTATIGSVTLTQHDSICGYSDAFVAKYNSAGTVLWAKSAGGSGDDDGTAICVDDSGHCYITGTFQSSATFDSDTLTTATGGTVFVAKYNTSDGSGVWANDVRTNYGTGSNAIAVRASKVCIAGWFYVNAFIGEDTLDDGDTDPMLAAFSSYTGDELWGRRTGHYLVVEDAQDVVIDASGNVYYCGSFGNTGYFSSVKYPGSLTYPPQSITANGSPDFFIAKYGGGGELLYVIHADGGTSTIATALEVDGSGNIYCAGTFTGTLSVGSLSVTAYSNRDVFVLQLAGASPTWLVQAGNISASVAELVSGIAIDTSGNSYIVGAFGGWESESWKTVFGADTLVGFYGSDIYVAKLNSSGVFQWAEDAGGYNPSDYGYDLALDGSGNIYVGGLLDCNYGAVGYFSHVSYSGAGSAGFLGKMKTNLHTGSVSASYCSGAAVNVSYTADVTFNTGNVFTAQLSDENGHFNSPVTIGTKSSKKSGTIYATIPIGTTTGTKYRIRVIGSSPSTVGNDNGKNISIGTMPDVTVTPPGPVSVCKPATADLSVSSCSGCFYQWYKSSTPQSGATTTSFSAGKTGSYKVIVTTSTGCSAASALVSVTVNPLPTATISPSGTVDICSTGSVVLTANSGAGLSYKWKKGTAYISGATDITYTATTTGTYKVEVTDANGCSKASGATKVIKTCREGDLVSGENSESAIVLYPNPASEKLMINCSSLIVLTIEVYDALGRKVSENKISDGESVSVFSIDVSSFNPGVYFIRLMMQNGTGVSQKFVKN